LEGGMVSKSWCSGFWACRQSRATPLETAAGFPI
jgi:hypothetical protein